MKNIITKGRMFYEIQILMYVFMWQHTWSPLNTDRDKSWRPHYQNSSNRFRCGRIYIWNDTEWTKHGFIGEIINFFHDLFKNTNKFKHLGTKFGVTRINAKNMFNRWFDRNRKLKIVVADILVWFDDLWIVNIYRHIRAFMINIGRFVELYDAGFRIGCFTDPDLKPKYARYRFFWKKAMIRDMADIGRYGNHWTSTFQGHVEHLDTNDLPKARQ